MDTSTSEGQNVFPWKFSTTVPADATPAEPTVVTRELNVDCVITRIEAVSNEAAQQAVGVRVEDASGERWLPRNPVDNDNEADDYVGVDDHPITARPNIPMENGDEVDVSFINNDSEPHYVRVLIYVREVGR